MRVVDLIAWILLILGGINWGLVGLFGFNLVEAIFSQGAVTLVIYALIGLAAIYAIFRWKNYGF